MKLSEKIFTLRKKQGLSQEGLAERSRFYGFTICIEVFGYGVSELLSPLEEGRKTWISQIQKKTRLQTKRYQQMCG